MVTEAPRLYNKTKTVEKALTVGTDAYTANDVVGGLITITVPESRGGTIRRVNLVDADNEDAAFTLHFFDQLPSIIADDAAFAPTIADLKKRVGVVTIAAGDYRTDNGMSVADKHDVNFDVDGNRGVTESTASASGKIYAYLVATATPTYTAATDLTLLVTVWTES